MATSPSGPAGPSGPFGSFINWGRRDLRVSDAEREAVVDSLRHHAGEGRLTVDELTQRVEQAYGARTIGELEAVQRDLPRTPALRYGGTVVPVQRGARRLARRQRSLLFFVLRLVLLNVALLVVWAVGGANTHDFWPIWPLAISAIWLAFRGLRVLERTALSRRTGRGD